MFFKITVAYDGTAFSGWQRQRGQRTVQQAVEDAWQAITGEAAAVTASGRTDAGVHAVGQVVGIESGTQLACSQLVMGLNAKLPDDVLVRRVEPAPDGFHATADARSKRYRYLIHNGRMPPLFDRQYVWHVPSPLDADRMHEASQRLVGTHDFACFQSVGSPRESTVRTIQALTVRRGNWTTGFGLNNDDQIAIEVTGDGFLYHMVRTIAGTLVRVGQGRRDGAWLDEVLAGGDRRAAGQTAPASGLMLMEVWY